MPGSRSKSRYSTCLSPLGFTIGLLPPSAVMGAPSFKFCTGQEGSVSVARGEADTETGSVHTETELVCLVYFNDAVTIADI